MTEKLATDSPVIVGIGASAGGLEAFQSLLTGLPDEHELVIVLIQHLDPNHESLMPELVAAKTKSPVHSVTDGMKVETGHIYLMPPGYEMEISGRTLKLADFESPRGLRRPIDRFFNSLAAEHGDHAAAVVLSGTGSDGANGARELKGKGGLVLVQDPSQAKYDGMPRGVMDLGGADVVANSEEIIDVVRDYFNLRVDREGAFGSDEEFLLRILRHVRFRTGHDFSEYKNATMLRRIAVRMSVLNITKPEEYLKYIVETKSEGDLLFRDLLINVTSFFRDADHFETLKKSVIPELVDAAEEHGELRIWVAGCSTGEEAYTIGMLVAEEISRVKKPCHAVIFGTDIDEQALHTARQGLYPDTLVDSIPPALLERYFKPVKDGYEVGAQLREMVRFSRHSFIKDPPFSKLDLVSCRNVLIYLKDSLQVLSNRIFHYALREDGYLFLGPSENPKDLGNLFSEVAARARIFKRRPGPSKTLNLGRLSVTVMNRPSAAAERANAEPDPSDAERIILDEFAPAYLQVDVDGKVTFASQNAKKYLSVRGGAITTDLFQFVSPELEATFRRLSRLKATDDHAAEYEFQGKIGDQQQRLIVSARATPDGGQLFVIKDNLQLLERRPSASGDTNDNQESYIRQLESELDDARQAVRTTVEELETSNEELKSSNEEMMSMNEELQSANEELTTINDELQEKLRELNLANINLKSFEKSARIATVFLDGELNLLRYTTEATEYFSFSASDIGRPMTDLNSVLEEDDLLDLCALTVSDKQERDAEFQTKDGDVSLSVRIMPYAPEGGQSLGVVFTLQNVTELRDAIKGAHDAKSIAEVRMEEVEQIYSASPIAMGLVDTQMRYVRLNSKLAEINGMAIENIIGRTIREVIPAVAEHTESLVKKVLETETPILGERVRGSTLFDPDNRRVWESDWTPFYSSGELTGVSFTVRDITEEVDVADNLRLIMGELEHRVKNMLSNVTALVNRASREATTDSEVFKTLSDRVRGLANTHALLTSESWSSASLEDIIRPETVDIYGEERVTLSGPNIKVTSEATLALGMAIHELSTNAAKYGAFSVPEGHVTISWSRINDAESDRLVINWVETGGPKVERPEKLGFGSQLISSTLTSNLDGDFEKSWEPSGLRVVIKLGFEENTIE
ncbi:CheBRA [Sulfitobacter noctilucae]|uniref:CheR family methyltransferase n=1 Tax=Sulfitobacter noctilucae TaxID=1342302 RepID=UPI000469E100|nr:CheR family methyltransferase [Sulfitobacter noctilucae]KIN70976.1 CheBRA [Sulfitobacter noctilucae]